ncbi:MAG: hypothetical protein R3D98_03640 [Candidatus Krumholzibacteriia bacterium]
MTLAAAVPVLTSATLPLLGPREAAVSLAALGVLGAVIAAVAHQGYRDGGREAWRLLRNLGLALAPMAFLRVVTQGWLDHPRPVLSAAYSLLDLMLLALATLACARLLDSPRRRLCRLVALAPMGAAVFLGLLGGDVTQPLLVRNAAAAWCHLAAYLVLAIMIIEELVHGLRRRRDAAEARAAALVLERSRSATRWPT